MGKGASERKHSEVHQPAISRFEARLFRQRPTPASIEMRATPALLKRTRYLQLTGKTGPKDYYKGFRSGSMGQHTKKGGYIVDYDKVRHYVVPDGLADFKVIGRHLSLLITRC